MVKKAAESEKEQKAQKSVPQNNDYLYFELEKSRMKRENALLILNKSFIFYFAYLVVGVVGFINNYVDKYYLNILVLLGLLVLFIGTIPFVKTMRSEEKRMNEIIASLKNQHAD